MATNNSRLVRFSFLLNKLDELAHSEFEKVKKTDVNSYSIKKSFNNIEAFTHFRLNTLGSVVKSMKILGFDIQSDSEEFKISFNYKNIIPSRRYGYTKLYYEGIETAYRKATYYLTADQRHFSMSIKELSEIDIDSMTRLNRDCVNILLLSKDSAHAMELQRLNDMIQTSLNENRELKKKLESMAPLLLMSPISS